MSGDVLTAPFPWFGGPSRKVPSVGPRGVTSNSLRGRVSDHFRVLQDRLRDVRVICGDWTRVLSDAYIFGQGPTGVFLDPPYTGESDVYTHGSDSISKAVRAWAVDHGDDRRLRIALCGYEGEHDMPRSWRKYAWKAQGGYANQGGNNENAHRERIWFSPHCHAERQVKLFAV